MMPRSFRWLALAMALSLSATVANAQLTFSFEATATQYAAENYGYTADHPYEFVITLNKDYSAGSTLYGNENFWEPTDKPLYGSVSGDGLSGEYISTTAEQMVLGNFSCFLYTEAGHNYFVLGPSPFYLTCNIDYPMGPIEVDCYLSDVTFLVADPAADPETYFSSSLSHSGVQALAGGVIAFDGTEAFEITGLSITGFSPVPEPASYAALIGAAALGFVAWRRRRAA